MRIRHEASIAPLFVLALVGCQGGPSFTDGPRIVPNPNPAAPLAAVLSFEADTEVATSVEIIDGARRVVLEFDANRDPAAGLPVVGFAARRVQQVAVTIRDQGGRSSTVTVDFTAPELPEERGSFPPLAATQLKPDRMEPGYTLFSPLRDDVRLSTDGTYDDRQRNFGMLVVIDPLGTPIWVYRSDSRISDFETLDNGNLLFLTEDYRLIEIDWLGNERHSWYPTGRPEGPVSGAIAVQALTFHHDVDEISNGNLMVLGTEIREIDDYYTSETDARAPRARQRVVGDLILEIERETGHVVWSWSAFDHLDPFRIGYETFSGYWERRGFPDTVDWSHANSIYYDEEDESLIVSFRNQAAAVKIDRATSEILWVFGEPEGWADLSGRAFRLASDARWPFHPHSVKPTPHGTLLVFDNGGFQARPFAPPLTPAQTHSRAVEYLIDTKIMVAGEVWVSERAGPESVVSFAMGDVDWLAARGNILVAYGALIERGRVEEFDWTNAGLFNRWTRLREYTHDSPPELVWEVVIEDSSAPDPIGWSVVGAERLKSLQP